jgi:hypothetical protein
MSKSEILKLKKRAKNLSKESGVKLHVALDAVAKENGFFSWKELIKK